VAEREESIHVDMGIFSSILGFTGVEADQFCLREFAGLICDNCIWLLIHKGHLLLIDLIHRGRILMIDLGLDSGTPKGRAHAPPNALKKGVRGLHAFF
jgi:hypothetical protein